MTYQDNSAMHLMVQGGGKNQNSSPKNRESSQIEPFPRSFHPLTIKPRSSTDRPLNDVADDVGDDDVGDDGDEADDDDAGGSGNSSWSSSS